MRRFISILLAVIMTLGMCTFVHAEDTAEKLMMLGYVPSSAATEPDEAATRGELAYSAVKLMGQGALGPVDTKFSDVPKTHEYSGYVSYINNAGIMNGIDDGIFAPDDAISANQAAKVFVMLLGYEGLAESYGGYAGGYVKVAQEVGLFDGVNAYSDTLTKAEFAKIVDNLLTTGSAITRMMIENGQISQMYEKEDAASPYLTSKLKYSVYKGEITSINCKKQMVSFRVDSNKYKGNYVFAEKGTTLSLMAKDFVDLVHFENVPVTVWVNQEDEITYIEALNGIEVFYGVISSANGDLTDGAEYRLDSIERFTVWGLDEEYDVEQGADITFNDAYTVSQKPIVGSFAKIVLKDGMAESISLYGTKDGGLITAVDASKGIITYLAGTKGTQTIKDLSDKDNLKVFVNGESSTLSELREKSVFDYYITDDTAVIAASDRVTLGTIDSVSQNKLTIGAITYNAKDTAYSYDGGKTYRASNTYSQLMGVEVCAYLGPDGNIDFVHASTGETAKTGRFYGICDGVQLDSLSDDAQILVYNLEDTFEKKVYKITKNTQFEDTTRATFLSTANSGDYNSCYIFEVTDEGKVRKIKKPPYFSGYGTAAVSVTNFDQDAMPHFRVNGRNIYFPTTPVTAVYYDKDGNLAMTKVDRFTDLYYRDLSVSAGATLAFFAEDYYAAEPELVLLMGDLKQLTPTTNKNAQYIGIITDKEICLDKNGEEAYKLTVVGNRSGEFVVSRETVENQRIPSKAFIYYTTDGADFVEDIQIVSCLSLEAGIENSGLVKATLDKMTGSRVFLQPPATHEIIPFNPLYRVFLSYEETAKGIEVNVIEPHEAEYGDDVYFVAGEDATELRALIVVK